MSWSYVIEDPFAVSRIGAALIRWMIDTFLDIDFRRNDETAKRFDAEKRAEAHLLDNADTFCYFSHFPAYYRGLLCKVEWICTDYFQHCSSVWYEFGGVLFLSACGKKL